MIGNGDVWRETGWCGGKRAGVVERYAGLDKGFRYRSLRVVGVLKGGVNAGKAALGGGERKRARLADGLGGGQRMGLGRGDVASL